MNIREMQSVTGIDLLVGRLIDELKKQGLDKNTILVFTSDHGIFNGQYGLGGKAFVMNIVPVCRLSFMILLCPNCKEQKIMMSWC